MAWNTKNKNSTDLIMTEGDFGVEIDLNFNAITISALDTVRVEVRTEKNGDPILTKEYTGVTSVLPLSWTEEETALLTPGNYLYNLDWYSNGVFMCNLINNSKLQVKDK